MVAKSGMPDAFLQYYFPAEVVPVVGQLVDVSDDSWLEVTWNGLTRLACDLAGGLARASRSHRLFSRSFFVWGSKSVVQACCADKYDLVLFRAVWVHDSSASWHDKASIFPYQRSNFQFIVSAGCRRGNSALARKCLRLEWR